MSMDLTAKSPKAKIKHIGVGGLWWPIMLQETGAGYVIGYGDGRVPGSYVYRSGNSGSPVSNDGYKVSNVEAKAMAMVLRGYVSVNRFINKEWEEIPEPERTRLKEYKAPPDYKLLYRTGMHEDRLKQIENIAEFMEQSGGFKIT